MIPNTLPDGLVGVILSTVGAAGTSAIDGCRPEELRTPPAPAGPY